MKTRIAPFHQTSRAALALFGIATIIAPLLSATSASAQIPFFGWGEPQRRAPPPPRQQQFNPFGMFEPPSDPYRRERPRVRRNHVDRERERTPPPPPQDSSRAPTARAKEGTPATRVVVLGDSMADWLAYGLEDTYSDDADVAITRKNRPNGGLILQESRTTEGYDAVTATKNMLTGEKADFIVVMLGVADRQAIRERPAKAPTPAQVPGQTTPPTAIVTEPQAASLVHEFRSERWTELYTKRIDDMIAVLKGKGVPVLWVGLPAIRGARAKDDVAYLNELYRGRAEKAGITYVDVWDGFADENGDYAQYGPDYEGQVRRLRNADGVNFTKAGALKLGHLVERDLQRLMQGRNAPPVAAAPPPETTPVTPSGPAPRPDAGPVVPLTAATSEPNGLIGGGARTLAADPTASRVMLKGEAVTPPPGRADDFAWPRAEAAAAADEVIPVIQAAPATARPAAPAARKTTTSPAERATKRAGQAAASPPARERETRRPDG